MLKPLTSFANTRYIQLVIEKGRPLNENFVQWHIKISSLKGKQCIAMVSFVSEVLLAIVVVLSTYLFLDMRMDGEGVIYVFSLLLLFVDFVHGGMWYSAPRPNEHKESDSKGIQATIRSVQSIQKRRQTFVSSGIVQISCTYIGQFLFVLFLWFSLDCNAQMEH